jgi:hypothetical protein
VAPAIRPRNLQIQRTDPLASQGALLIGRGNQLLFAVNAGIRPISLALHDDLLYVLNEGRTPNITGFEIDEDGTLTPLAGSTQPLIGGTGADPAQIGFSHDGDLLVVTERSGNRINTYKIDDDGLPSAPIDNASNETTPFGFAFNKADTLVVSEAFWRRAESISGFFVQRVGRRRSQRDQCFSAEFSDRLLLGRDP